MTSFLDQIRNDELTSGAFKNSSLFQKGNEWIHAHLVKMSISTNTKLMFFASLLILLFAIVLFIPQMMELSQSKTEIAKIERDLHGGFPNIGLQKQLLDIKNAILLEKERIAMTNRKTGSMLRAIVPSDPELFALLRLLEDFTVRYSIPTDPLVLKNVQLPDLDRDTPIERNGFFVLPFQITLLATPDGLTRFLAFIEHSGSFDEAHFFKKQPVRLMAITSIQLPMGKKKTKEADEYTITLETFYQKTAQKTAEPSPKS